MAQGPAEGQPAANAGFFLRPDEWLRVGGVGGACAEASSASGKAQVYCDGSGSFSRPAFFGRSMEPEAPWQEALMQ